MKALILTITTIGTLSIFAKTCHEEVLTVAVVTQYKEQLKNKGLEENDSTKRIPHLAYRSRDLQVLAELICEHSNQIIENNFSN